MNRVLGRLGDKAHELAGVCTFVLVKPLKLVKLVNEAPACLGDSETRRMSSQVFKFTLALLAVLVQKYKILTRMRALAALMRYSSGFLLALLALLVQKYILTRMRALAALMRHRQRLFTCFTCFTGTKVQILTRMRALAALMRHSSGSVVKQGSLLLIGARFTCFTGKKVRILTLIPGAGRLAAGG